jgi:hypothetical protein
MVVAIKNGGNRASGPVNVTFYTNAALTNPIGTVNLPEAYGCARQEFIVQLPWSGLTPGVHRFWAYVDSANVLPESNENDNLIAGVVIVNGEQVALPFIGRWGP